MRTSIRNQQAFAWCGPLMILLWIGGFLVFARFIPPPAAAHTAQQTADLYAARPTAIRIGLLLTMIGSTLLGPFITVIFMQLRRIEGPSAPMSYLQLVFGVCLILEFLIPVLILQGAAYRQDRSAEAIQLLNDVGWLIFIGLPSTAVLQLIVIAIVILQDRSGTPTFPRWSAYASIFVGLSFAPAAMVVFFKDGPLAWNGLFAFWLPVGLFGPWIFMMTALMLRALTRQDSEIDGEHGAAPDIVLAAMRNRVDALEVQCAEMRAVTESK